MQCDEHIPANKTREAKKTIPLNLHIYIIQLHFQHLLQPNHTALLAALLSNKKTQTALHF